MKTAELNSLVACLLCLGCFPTAAGEVIQNFHGVAGSDITSVVKDGRYVEWRSSPAGKIAVTIIDNLRRGFYRTAKLRFAQPHREDLLRAVERWRAVPEVRRSFTWSRRVRKPSPASTTSRF